MLVIISMITAFLVLSGAALLFCNLLKMNMGEAMVMSATTLIGLIYVSGRFADKLTLGKNTFILLSFAGILITGIRIYLQKFDMTLIRNLYWPVLAGILLTGIFLYSGDFIRYIDEFHMWAAAPKYMLENNTLPIYNDFIGGSDHHFETSIFHYYFQSFTGFNEGMMYTSGLLLIWMGILLPLGDVDWSRWKESILYVLVIYFSIFTLYLYGMKNIMVDLPTAGWAGGLGGWIYFHKKKWSSLVFFLFTALLLSTFKGWAGYLLAGCLAGIFLLKTFLFNNKKLTAHQIKNIIRMAWIGLGILALVVICYQVFLTHVDITGLVPASIRERLILKECSPEKACRVLLSLLTRITGEGLAFHNSFLVLSFLEAMILCILIMVLYGMTYNRHLESKLLSIYLTGWGIIYVVSVLTGFYISISYNEAIRTSGGSRYLSIYVIFFFIFGVALLLLNKKESIKSSKLPYASGLVLMTLFLYGITANVMENNTAWNQTQASHYDEIQEQREQAFAIEDIMKKDDRVYFLNQKSDKLDEFGNNPALFYLDSQLSDVRNQPWRYVEGGAYARLDEFDFFQINGFPDLLASGGFRYVWIYKTDDYLNRNLPRVISMPERSYAFAAKEKSLPETEENPGDQGGNPYEEGDNPAGIIDGQLYKVVYDKKGQVKELKLVKNFAPFNSRTEYKAEK